MCFRFRQNRQDSLGAVGEFKLSSSINSTDVKTNDAVTVKLTLSGTGNMKLISAPEVNFPQDFEVYDPKTTDNTKLTNAGVSEPKRLNIWPFRAMQVSSRFHRWNSAILT